MKSFQSFLLVLFCFTFSIAKAQKHQKTKNIVIILIDGYRWQELFKGADHDLLTNEQYNEMDAAYRMKKFWSDDLEKRRKKLMPFTWNYMAKQGQIYGNRAFGNKVNVKNPYWFSYPGRAETLSGFVDEKINSNNYGNNTNPNVLAFLNQQKKYRGQVVSFLCWRPAGLNLNLENSKMLINVPWENIEGKDLTETEILANEMQHWLPKVWGNSERLDAEVYALAKAYIQAKHPRVIYIDFGDTDEYAHAGKYTHYLFDIHNIDAMIGNLWKMMQNDKFYKDKTTFFIVPDHGRGVGNQWTSHGSSIPHSDETWLMVLGPDTSPKGVMKKDRQIYQMQFAATIAQLLGFNYSVPDRKVGNPIKSVLR